MPDIKTLPKKINQIRTALDSHFFITIGVSRDGTADILNVEPVAAEPPRRSPTYIG